MGRTPSPWFWEDRGAWYAVVGGRRRLLAKGKANKAEAKRVLVRLQAEESPGGVAKADALDLNAVIDLFLVRVERECAATTLEWYKVHLDRFAGKVGAIPSADLRPKHLDSWISTNGPGWSDSTRRGAITAVKAMSSWACRMGYLSSDPLKAVPRPRMGRRAAVAPESTAKILAAAGDEAFSDLLVALIESGCRPGEVFKVTAADVDSDATTWTIRGKTTSRTGKPRVIYLTAKLAEITRKLIARNPAGCLFLNSKGNPWNRNAVRCRFRKKGRVASFGKIKAYGLRHLYGTDALTKQGVPVAVVAELMGHSDLKMLSEHYGHLDERTAALRGAAASIRPSSAPGSSGSDEKPS
jgi:integrase